MGRKKLNRNDMLSSRPRLCLTLAMLVAMAASISGGAATVDVDGLVVERGTRDAAGLRRDTYYFMGLQFFATGFLYAMPESVSNWDDRSKEQAIEEWPRHVREPKWDDDTFVINYVTHPYWGATYFVRARERGYGPWGAFAYSTLLSTMYEFGLEAAFEHPSEQDLFITPIVGSWLGTYFMRWRDETKRRVEHTGTVRLRDSISLAVTDPLGTVGGWLDRKLGIDSMAVVPFMQQRRVPGAGPQRGQAQRVYGFHIRVDL